MDTKIDPKGTSMAKLLSTLLILGQVVLSVGCAILLFMALILAIPSGMRENFINDMPATLNPSTLWALYLAKAVIAVSWFIVLGWLRHVVRAVIHGDPFLTKNVSRLRNIWMMIAVTEVFRMIAYFIIGVNGDCQEVDGARLDIRIGTWFFIFIVATISEAFRHGAALRADQELTI